MNCFDDYKYMLFKMSDTGFIFSLVSDVLPGFRNIWYSPIIPYNLLGVYRVEQIMEITDFTRKRSGIHMYLENNVNVHNEFLHRISRDRYRVNIVLLSIQARMFTIINSFLIGKPMNYI